jgi:hypothetical protein
MMTIPDLEGFETYYGVPISAIGEDGDLITLGHHDKRRALAALNRYAKSVYGFLDLYDGLHPSRPMVDDIAEMWATLKQECDQMGDDGHDESKCGECIELANSSWWIECGTKQVSGSFPVMYWRV